MKTTKEMIEVMQAFEDGEDIQADCYDSAGWHDIVRSVWNWSDCDYRIKPKPREVWINEYEDGCKAVYDRESFARNYRKPGGETIKFREVMEDES